MKYVRKRLATIEKENEEIKKKIELLELSKGCAKSNAPAAPEIGTIPAANAGLKNPKGRRVIISLDER